MGSTLTHPKVIQPLRRHVGKRISLRAVLGPSLPITILLFCGGFNYAYINWVSPTWSYLGLTYNSPDAALIILGYVFAMVLSLLSPRRIQRPSHVIYWFCFFVVYVPGLFIPLYLKLENSFSLLLLQLSLSGGMLLIALSYRISRFAIRSYPLDRRFFWTVFTAVYILGNAALIYTFQGMFHFASINDVYSVRTPAKHVFESAPAIAYVSQILANVMNPFLMGYGVSYRRRSLFVLGVMGDLLLYSTAAVKLNMVAPIAIVIFYHTLKRDRGGWVPTMAMLFAAMFFLLTGLAVGLQPGPLFNIASLLLVRTFTIPGSEMGEYQHFFSNMPHTYLGHVTGINHFLPNPYQLSMGEEVGSYFGVIGKYGLSNANASFFAMDGIGGFGLGGILVMGVLCAVVFWILDSCARDYELKFSVPLLAMVIMSLTNVSLFTTLLGNGLIIWMILFILMPREMRIQTNEGARERGLPAR
jgi:hypothetical protein